MSHLKKFVSIIIIPVFLGLIIAKCLSLFVFQTNIVRGPSMEPTLQDKDYLITEKVSFWWGKPKYNDIVIVESEDKHLIKRVIGAEGDVLEFVPQSEKKPAHIIKNGEVLEEDYLLEEMYIPEHIKIEVPNEAVFALGDNRNNSLDSRVYGYFHEDDVVGKVFVELFNNFKFH